MPSASTNLAPEQVAAQWEVLPKPAVPQGWLVFSGPALVRALQGKRDVVGPVEAGVGVQLLVAVIQVFMCLLQPLIMLLAVVPILGTLLEPIVTHWRRGAAGFFLRGAYWKARLRRLGQDTLIDRGVEIWGPRNISIGAGCHIDTGVRLAAGEKVFGQHGRLTIGDFTHLGPRVHIAARGGVTVGDLVSLQAGVHVYSASNSLFDPHRPSTLLSFSHAPPGEYQVTIEQPVRIEDYVSVGYASLILPGVTLGRAAVVHPFAQVNNSFPPFANIVGPGRAHQNGWRRPLRPLDRRQPEPGDRAAAADATSANVPSAASVMDASPHQS